MKVTAIAPANIAFIKYWGKKDEELRLPTNGSISVNLSNLLTTTTVEFNSNRTEDEVVINDRQNEKERQRVTKHLDRIRKLAKIDYGAHVISKNTFPTASGLASSASGFAALTVAASVSAGLSLSEKELTILARLGSGSACRSIPSGYVEWLKGSTSDSSYAKSLYPPNYWEMTVLVVVVESKEKEVSTIEGHERVRDNPFFPTRLSQIDGKIKALKDHLANKDFQKFGALIEAEALELHAIALTSRPPILYWQPATIAAMRAVWQARQEGVDVYFTIDAGAHLHLLCEKKHVEFATAKLKQVKGVKEVIANTPALGARLTDQHLF